MGKKKIRKIVTGIDTIKDMIDDRLSLIEGDELYWGPVNEEYQLDRYDDLQCVIKIIEESTGIDLHKETNKLINLRYADRKRLERNKEIEKLKAEGKWQDPDNSGIPTLGERVPAVKTAYLEDEDDE